MVNYLMAFTYSLPFINTSLLNTPSSVMYITFYYVPKDSQYSYYDILPHSKKLFPRNLQRKCSNSRNTSEEQIKSSPFELKREMRQYVLWSLFHVDK